ncbi:uncharacterized protein LOC131066784 isoform X2 [Cryptomeria japonica]|uniref:uncharacterized protein LOC131066784 isoform X2 n=1 Tax=Cryptomeria japonica TaxID=3369 RepID=UPI0025ABB446|nr:uncharacterized protein LOC131066784 isoform X2 [Cryptomeria japonica]
MEVELEPRVKALPYKIRGMSRESPTQKAVHVLDPDLRTHWSTATNTKEWILLELEETCLLSHIRIHNKSVLEWEIAVGLRFKPDMFLKVRPRCEAPRRDMVYPINYMPCRFVRISCLRGNPIAIFFVQLIGVPVPGLEQEFQPVVDYLLPHIVLHKQDTHDIYLQLLQDVTCRLSPFLPQLESELSNFAEAVESNIRFLAMLAAPFYPILCIVGERESAKVTGGMLDMDPVRSNQGILTISSNFQAQPRRLRAPVPNTQQSASSLVFRPDAVLLLLRKAYKDNHLGNVCRSVARLLRKLTAPGCSSEVSQPLTESVPLSGSEDVTAKVELAGQTPITDYSHLFGEEFKIFEEDMYDVNISNVLDVAAVEEGLLHMLYACSSQPIICRRLGDSKTDLLPALPLIQAMLPALRPAVGSASNSDQVDETFWQWQNPLVQHSLTQIAAVSSSSSYQPLLDACAGYLSSYSPAHARAACVLLDLCSGPLAPWLPMVIAKVDLTIELLEDLLGVIQNAQHAIAHARAALIYIMLALSGHMDDLLPKFKDAKHSILFLIEMLEPFLVPAITTIKNTIAFGDVSTVFLEKQEKICAIALDLLCTAVQRPAVLPALENEWRRGVVEPSVLLSILAPHVPLPPGINLCKSSMTKGAEHEASTFSPVSSAHPSTTIGKISSIEEDVDGKSDMVDGNSRNDATEDGSLLFAPAELKNISLRKFSTPFEGNFSETQGFGQANLNVDGKLFKEKDNISKKKLTLDIGCANEYFDLQREYLQLVNHQDRELRASEFRRFAEELHAQSEINLESHDAAIDALLLAAECHLNPYFMMGSSENEQLTNIIFANKDSTSLHVNEIIVDEPSVGVGKSGAKIIAQLEGMRDKTVIDILLQAAQWDSRIHNATLNERSFEDKSIDYDFEERPYGIKIFPDDVQSADAVTLVRQHQSLLCGFLVRQLQREQHNMYEVLLHGLLFFLYSATHVSCHSENVVDVILQSAERLNRLLFSLHQEQKETSPPVEPAKIHRVRRQWALLQRIVFVASGNGIMEDGYMHIRRGCWYRDLIPVSSWMDRISKFSSSPLPLVRYIGWMGLARYATEHKKRGLLLTQDMRQLTGLLSIFSDELISVKSSFKGKENEGLQDACFLEFNVGRLEKPVTINSPLDSLDSDGVVHAFYPEMDVVFPELRKHFFTYAEIMLEAVCLQVKAMPPCSIPDILSWFSELCSNPFLDLDRDQYAHVDASDDILKGVVVSNVKCILLHILEVIVLEHMEAIIPEIPRVIQVLLSLCSSSYCDVPLLDSVLSALKPLISYTVATASASEKFVEDDPSSMNFESLCFDALINQLESGPEQKKGTMVNTSQGALLIFLAGSLLSDLSISRRRQLMQSLLQWAKFTGFQATTTYYNYLCAFRKVLEGCNSLVQETLRDLGASLMNEHPCSKKDSIDFICKELSVLELCDRGRKTLDLYGVQQQEERSMVADSFQVKDQTNTGDGDIIEHGTKRAGSNALQHFSCISDVEDFTKSLEALIFMLSPTIEICWKFHSQMTRKLSQTGAACLLYSGFLLSNYQSIHSNKSIEKNESSQFVSESEQNLFVWQNSLQGLGQAVLTLQQNHCWQVAAVLLEYLLSLPSSFSLDGVLGPICSALLFVCCHAPKVTWRLQTGKWLSKLFQRDCLDFSSSTSSLVDLFCTMLEHSEPEQRYIALQHLGRIVEHEELGKLTSSSISGSSSTHMNMVMTVKRVSQRGVVSALVANTWDRIASLAACEPSMTLRKEAMELLERFIPFSERYQLRSFFSSVDTILPGLCMPSYSMQDGPLTVLGLSVLARACLYSEADDIDIISPSVWDNLELLAKSKNEIIPVAAFIHAEKAVCHALLQLKEHGEEAKEILKAALGRSSEDTQVNPDLADVRESVLQVLARLNSIRSKSDGFTEFAEKEAKELEEAEIELELMQEEKTLQEGLKNSSQIHQTIRSSSRPPMKSTHQRLQELRTQIRDMEHSEIRAEIAARRERERIARRTRQMTLEETALREIELLQDLDRERIAEVEREVERQKVLEKERAKTRELRHSLDLETERRTQTLGKGQLAITKHSAYGARSR